MSSTGYQEVNFVKQQLQNKTLKYIKQNNDRNV